MDTKRIPAREYSVAADRAFQAYQQLKPDLVVLGDDNALYYLLPKLYNEPISIVFLGINSNPRELLDEYSGIAQVTGILEQPLFVKNMAEIGRLLPKENGVFWCCLTQEYLKNCLGLYARSTQAD